MVDFDDVPQEAVERAREGVRDLVEKVREGGPNAPLLTFDNASEPSTSSTGSLEPRSLGTKKFCWRSGLQFVIAG